MYNDDNEYRFTREDIIQEDKASSGSERRAYYTPYDEGDNRPKKEKKPKKSGGVFKFIGKAVAAGLIFGLVAGLTFNGTNLISNNIFGNDSEEVTQATTPNQTQTAQVSTSPEVTKTNVVSATALDVSAVVENAMPSIVSISCISDVNYYWMTTEATSAGSGIIVAETEEYLYIATNNHVISGAKSITVNFVDDAQATAEVKGTDPDNDLAVISVKISDLTKETYSAIKVISIGDSDSLKVGETAIAIGNALGYGQSVTTGVISALNREVTVDSVTNELIQTDAAINPGNSGGALINSSGELIGINSSKYSETSVEGMGFAIPIATAMPIIEELIEREVVDESKSAYLGVSGTDVTSSVAQMYNMPEGLYIAKVVAGSAAENGGLRQGDILTAFDGHSISSMEDLQNIIQYYEAGTTIDLTIQRMDQGGYSEMTLTVTLGRKTN